MQKYWMQQSILMDRGAQDKKENVILQNSKRLLSIKPKMDLSMLELPAKIYQAI